MFHEFKVRSALFKCLRYLYRHHRAMILFDEIRVRYQHSPKITCSVDTFNNSSMQFQPPHFRKPSGKTAQRAKNKRHILYCLLHKIIYFWFPNCLSPFSRRYQSYFIHDCNVWLHWLFVVVLDRGLAGPWRRDDNGRRRRRPCHSACRLWGRGALQVGKKMSLINRFHIKW